MNQYPNHCSDSNALIKLPRIKGGTGAAKEQELLREVSFEVNWSHAESEDG